MCTTPDEVGLVMELGQTNLLRYLEETQLLHPVPPARVQAEAEKYTVRWSLAYQLAAGLQFVHDRGLVHCDVKANNAILKLPRAMWGDFGLCTTENRN